MNLPGGLMNIALMNGIWQEREYSWVEEREQK